MTLRGFFTDRIVLVGIVLGLFVGTYAYVRRHPAPEPAPQPAAPISQVEQEAIAGIPDFAWRYEKSEQLDLDGQPQTALFLEATYPGGKVERKLVDTKPGSCNDLPDPDVDSFPGTMTAQCYAAGLGYRYKVTRGVATYEVKRRSFEEALPGVTPPETSYEVIAEFPLSV